MNVIGSLNIARAALVAAAAAGWGAIPRMGVLRFSSDSEQGRRFISRKYRSSMTNKFVGVSNGEREVARRQRQIEQQLLHPVYRAA